MRPHGRARISRANPEAQGVCDRCGARYTHNTLKWQFDWAGARLQNRYILVCDGCLDVPQENIRTIVLPPDPRPIANPRPEQFTSDDNPISGIGWDPANLFSLTGPTAQSAFFGNLTGGGGVDSVFVGSPGARGVDGVLAGSPAKMAVQAAHLTPSAAISFAGINWSATAGAPPQIAGPSSVGPPTQSYSISRAHICAPVDAAFLGTNLSTTVQIQGSNDLVAWTTLFSTVTAGTKGESITAPSSSFLSLGFFSFHRIVIVGDGAHQAALAYAELRAAGPSLAQTGSELGA
jgi:hypothetical protein